MTTPQILSSNLRSTKSIRGNPIIIKSSWGRLGNCPHSVVNLQDRNQVSHIIKIHKPGIAFGNGRSYGDVCLNPGGILWNTRGLDRFFDFDQVTGRLRCEAGMLLRDIHRLTVPSGWMIPVTPGTQLITVGGAIANDFHGKNHHRMGTFGNFVHDIKLLRTTGEIFHCGPEQKIDLFSATLGGLGLTGVITEAELQLRKVPGPWLESETIPYKGTSKNLRY